jgi:hypothetical protein
VKPSSTRQSLRLIALLISAVSSTVHGSVSINELMYHPLSVEEAEFVELINSGAAPVDLQDWCFEGIDFCFAAGATIGPGQYLVLARDQAQFEAAYGFSADFVYLTELDNSGERIALLDDTLGLVDEVEYLTTPPWPVTPDGLGPSLEVIDPSEDNATPRNWRAATNGPGHTAGAVNSVDAAGLPPWIANVVHTPDVQPGETIVVTAEVLDAANVEFFYLLDFGSEVPLAMLDDGSSGDGGPGDGVYGASIPGQPVGTLVRYRIHATGPTGTQSFPRTDDTVTYSGTAVIDPLLSSALPIFHWFIDPDDFDNAIAHKFTDETEPAVFFYDGVVYDNVLIRVRGRKAREWPKLHWKFILPPGHEFYDPDLIINPVDNFNLQGHYSDKTYLRERLAWETAREAGAPWNQTFHVRLEQNGAFFGLYSFLEDPDRDWLLRNGLDVNAARYKAFNDLRKPNNPNQLENDYEKQSRLDEDYSDLFDFVTGINDLTGQELRDFIFDNVDLPTTINYVAAISVFHDNDHVKKNYYVYRDTEGTQRWTLHMWDKDLTFGRNFNGSVLNDAIWADVDVIAGRPGVSPSHPLFGDSEHQKYDFLWNRLIDKLHEEPEIREMYFRRLRTLADDLLAPGRYEAMIDALVPTFTTEADLDRAEWGQFGQTQTVAQAVGHLKNGYLGPRRIHLLTTHRVPGEIPEAQSPSPQILINEIMYQPAGSPDPEFIELYNPSPTEAVDLSGWRLDGAALSIPSGTVILPDDFLAVVNNDVLFRTTYGSGKFVAAQYGGVLDDGGERVALRDRDGNLVALVDYSSAPPWPTSAGGGGFSLELIDPTQPNGWAANWSASSVSGGTPCAPNSVAGTISPFPGLFINEVLPLNATINTDEQGEFDPWIEIYNASAASVDMGGMFLTDNHASPTLWEVPAGTNVCARCWLLFWADNEPGDGPLHTSFQLGFLGGTVGLYDASGTIVDFLDYGDLIPDKSYGRFPDGGPDLRVFNNVTPEAANDATLLPMIVNEYNAVSPGQFLDNGGSDTFWGTIPGNGGDWIELVVTEDRIDVRGWQLVVTDDTGGPGETTATLVFSNDSLWSNLRGGTLITVSEDLANNVSFDPAAGDWWINVQAGNGGDGTYISAQDFTVSNVNSQITIKDDGGGVVFGPIGEGINPLSGIGSDEVFKLEEDPTPFTTALSNYNDGTSSTFGAPNVFAGGTITQDFGLLRCDGFACASVEGECAVGSCDTGSGQCEVLPINEGGSCGEADACISGGVCTAGICEGATVDCSQLDDECIAGVCNSGTGLCETMPRADGTSCDDGLACTATDFCSAGSCLGTDTCTPGEVCQGNGLCAATTISTFQDDGNYTGTHDTTIYETAPDTPLGDVDSWEWDSESGDPPGQKMGLIRFDGIVGDGAGQITAGSRVVSAGLTLEVWDPSNGPAGDVREVLVNWDESSATWNSFGGDAGVQPDETGAFVASAPLAAGPAVMNVTASLESWVGDPSGNRGWIFLPNATNGVEVWSSEYAVQAERPQLTVEWLPPCTTAGECDDGLACNGTEVCASGRCQFGPPPAPPEVAGLVLEKSGSTHLTWFDQGAEFSYDVAGEYLSTLQSDGSVAGAACLANDVLVNSWDDTRPDPLPDEAYYYLLRPQSPCGPGTYGSSSSGSERDPLSDCGE